MPDDKAAIDNMRIWTLANETDPTHTKNASLGAYKFTSIDSYYQIKRCTEHFGPMGQGWGYASKLVVIDQCTPPLMMIEFEFWYIDPLFDAPGTKEMPPYDIRRRVICPLVRAANKLTDNSGKVDEECFKKATTDALTKALSYLGFSADIFMGRYDDAKYRAEIGKKFEDKRAADGNRMPETLDAIVKSLPSVKNLPDLEKAHYSVFGNKKMKLERHPDMAKVNEAQFDYIMLQFKRRKMELDPVEPEETKDLGDQAGA